MFSLNAGGRDLALPQRNGPGFDDSPWKPLPFWVEWMEVGWWGWGRQRAGWEGEVWLECKIKFFEKLNIKKKYCLVRFFKNPTFQTNAVCYIDVKTYCNMCL